VAGRPFVTVLDGDASIRKRPMDRVARPLREMGARVEGLGERCLPPVRIEGGGLLPVDYTLPMASAQVKSCVLLAGCSAEGVTRVTEPAPTRDHTERMLAGFGASIHREGDTVSLEGPASLRACDIEVPGDLSSAAFPLVAGLLVPGSRVTVTGMGVNPTRTGLLDLLRAMRARLSDHLARETGGEPVADVTAEPGPLAAGAIAGALVPRLVDEVPIAALCGCFAEGPLTVSDAAELRVKESDRIEAVARAIGALGGRVETRADGLTVYPSRLHAGVVESLGDHRIAMMAAVAGLACEGTTLVRDTECIETSFPGFAMLLRSLGAEIEEVDE
jgi:3-phosphoshikimate 1-carboxyvinyltransferase